MKFSLIIATLGREKELYNLFESLVNQLYKNFEVIVVDQNEDSRVKKCVEKYRNLIEIKYLKSEVKGASYNRNKGLGLVSGDIVAFTDDDCIYDSLLLETVKSDFVNKNVDFLSYMIVDPLNGKLLSNYPLNEIKITTKNMFKCTMCASIFIKYKEKSDLYFDEEFGVGSTYGSCEDSDLIFKIINYGHRGMFIPEKLIYHPSKTYPPKTGYTYGVGLGAFIKKTIVVYKRYDLLFFYLGELIKAMGGIIVRKEKRKYYYYTLKGRIQGFINYKSFITK